MGIAADEAAYPLTAAEGGDEGDGEHREAARQLIPVPVIPHQDAGDDGRAAGRHPLQGAQDQEQRPLAGGGQQQAEADKQQE